MPLDGSAQRRGRAAADRGDPPRAAAGRRAAARPRAGLAAQLGVSIGDPPRRRSRRCASMGLVETKRGGSAADRSSARRASSTARSLELPLLRAAPCTSCATSAITAPRSPVRRRCSPPTARSPDDVAGRCASTSSACAPPATLTERRRADARIHIEIAAAAQSPRLTREEISLWSQVGDLLWLPPSARRDARP